MAGKEDSFEQPLEVQNKGTGDSAAADTAVQSYAGGYQNAFQNSYAESARTSQEMSTGQNAVLGDLRIVDGQVPGSESLAGINGGAFDATPPQSEDATTMEESSPPLSRDGDKSDKESTLVGAGGGLDATGGPVPLQGDGGAHAGLPGTGLQGDATGGPVPLQGNGAAYAVLPETGVSGDAIGGPMSLQGEFAAGGGGGRRAADWNGEN